MTEKLTIDTPEQVTLEFALAGVGSRFLALAVDTLIQGLLMVAVLLAVVAASSLQTMMGGNPGFWAPAVGVVCAFLVFYGYFAAFEALQRGQTPGKRLVGLRVIGVTGRPATAQQVLIRNLIRIVDQLPGPYAVGIISVLLTSRSQRLGDLAAGTVVVHERPEELEQTIGDVGRHPRRGAHGLAEQEVAVIEAFLRRRSDLDWEVRERTAGELADRVRRRLSLPPGGSHEELLEQVATEYRSFGTYR